MQPVARSQPSVLQDGGLRLDRAADWDDGRAPDPVTPEDQLLCDASAVWLCSQSDCEVRWRFDGGWLGRLVVSWGRI